MSNSDLPDSYVKDMLEMIAQPPVEIEEAEDLDPLFHFIADYVAKIYGTRAIQKKLSSKKGLTLIKLLTTSDIAYAYAVCINQEDVWIKWHEISQLEPDEQKKWKKPSKLSAEEKERYKMKEKPKFTSREGKKLQYLAHGWNGDGQDLYRNTKHNWKLRYNNKAWWDAFEVAWGDYVMKTGAFKHWKETSTVREDTTNNQGEDEDASPTRNLPANRFSCPGDDDFEEDRAWAASATQEGEDGVEDYDDESGRHAKRARVSLGGDSDSSSDDDE